MALRYGLHRNQIFGWRRQFRDGMAKGDTGSAGFVPLAIAASSGEAGGIELIYGGVTIRVGSGFPVEDLRRVLQVVRIMVASRPVDFRNYAEHRIMRSPGPRAWPFTRDIK